MKLINDTIELLGNADEPLEKSLIKAQIIAHKLRDQEFSKWVKNELQGYSDGSTIPEYRQAIYTPHGNLENLARRYSNHQLPTSGIPKEMRRRVLTTKFVQSIGVIEGFAKSADKLKVIVDPSLYPYLMDGIDSSYSLTSAWGVIPAGTFTQILNETRSRLLDLLLNLYDCLPESAKDEDLPTLSREQNLNGMFKNAVFGDGVSINLAIGDSSNSSNNSATVVKNDLEALVKVLHENKVSETDINALKAAIASDAIISTGAQGFGTGVKSWLGEMIIKAGTPAWEIPAQIGAGILTAAISKFYGL